MWAHKKGDLSWRFYLFQMNKLHFTPLLLDRFKVAHENEFWNIFHTLLPVHLKGELGFYSSNSMFRNTSNYSVWLSLWVCASKCLLDATRSLFWITSATSSPFGRCSKHGEIMLGRPVQSVSESKRDGTKGPLNVWLWITNTPDI